MGGGGLRPAPGMPGSDVLPFMAAFGNPGLADCSESCLGWPWQRRRGGHTRECLRDRAQWQRDRELADALLPEDIRWLNDHHWDGRFS